MRHHTALAARTIYAVVLILAVADVVLFVLSRATPLPPGGAPRAVQDAWELLQVLVFSTMGMLIVTRQPRNVIGWTFLAAGFGLVTSAFGSQYAIYTLLTNPGVLPGGQWTAWVGNWFVVPTFWSALAALLLLFPDGRLVSPRWRPVAWLVVAWIVAGSINNPNVPLDAYLGVPSPIQVTGTAGLIMATIASIVWPVAPVVVSAAVASVVVRFRRARGEERQQLKLLAFAAAMIATGLLATGALHLLDDTVNSVVPGLAEPLSVVAAFVGIVGATGLPVAAGIAILRYRLYEIDRIISRTVAYTILSALLGFSYVTGVLVLSRVFDAGERRSPLAVAGSTLAVAALFQPLRRRIQAAVDRRFNRRRYDADRSAEAFSSRLRDNLDLETLKAELVGVVNRTLQPLNVSVWLRSSKR